MTNFIDIQHATQKPIDITDEQILKWAQITLRDEIDSAELTIRFADADEIMHLNQTYRKQHKPTNVLAFPANLPENIILDTQLLGDIIICPKIVYDECQELNKSVESHFALMVVHGILHLLGYDHIDDADAEVMQTKEIKILKEIGFANPYSEEKYEI